MSSFMNIKEFSGKIGVTPETASKKIKDKTYVAFKKGKSYRIPSCAIELKDVQDFEEKLAKTEAKTFMIGNHKGGSGKTTATINIAASLAFFGYKVLLVDMDNQSNASTINKLHLINDFDQKNITKLLLNMKELDRDSLLKETRESIVNVDSEHFDNGKLDLFPNSLEWDEKKEMLFTYPNAENMLNRLLRPLKKEYDFIIIDTHPSMDIMWRMSVMASDAIIIGMMAEQYSIEGLSGVFRRIYSLNEDYRENKGHDIEVLGAIVSNFRKNTNIAKVNKPMIEEAIQRYSLYNEAIVFEPFISHTIKIAEQQSLHGPIMFDDYSSKTNAEFLELTTNILFQLYLLDAQRGEN